MEESNDEPQRMHPDDLEAIIRAVRIPPTWLNAKEAAIYLSCKLNRIRKLTSTGDLPHDHDGGRVLYERSKLDEFVKSGGAVLP